MTNTKKQHDNVDNLAKEYASEVFGIEPNQDIRVIKTGRSGRYHVKDDINIDEGYYYQTLNYDDKPVANNDPKNAKIHKNFIKHARGRILISGLGLGESLNEILKNPDIEYVRILEKEQDIINLVADAFQDSNVEIIQADIFDYNIKEKFDCIYHAIWNDADQAKKAVKPRKKLKEKFAAFCSWQGFIYISSRGGARKGAGRKVGYSATHKPESEKKIVRKGIRYKQKELDIIKKACIISGKTEAEIAVTGAIKEATRILFKIDDSQLNELVKKALP